MTPILRDFAGTLSPAPWIERSRLQPSASTGLPLPSQTRRSRSKDMTVRLAPWSRSFWTNSAIRSSRSSLSRKFQKLGTQSASVTRPGRLPWPARSLSASERPGLMDGSRRPSSPALEPRRAERRAAGSEAGSAGAQLSPSANRFPTLRTVSFFDVLAGALHDDARPVVRPRRRGPATLDSCMTATAKLAPRSTLARYATPRHVITDWASGAQQRIGSISRTADWTLMLEHRGRR